MSAKLSHQQRQKIRIEASSGLSDAEIDTMVKQAEANASADKERREAIESRNQLDGLVYKVEKDSKEWVDRLAPDVKTRLDTAVEAGKQALKTGDPAGISTALSRLNSAYSAAGASLCRAPRPPRPRRPRRKARPPRAGRRRNRRTWSRPTTRSWTTARSSRCDPNLGRRISVYCKLGASRRAGANNRTQTGNVTSHYVGSVR
ncbi:MAG: Hsp70 family protein [Gemmatimonadales bacterium]